MSEAEHRAFELLAIAEQQQLEIQRIFHQLKGGKDEDFNPIPMDNWF
jgi:hypothetical protein